MGWRDSPRIMAAKEIADRFKKRQVIIIMVDRQGAISYASYGTSKKLCDDATACAVKAIDAITNG